VVFIGAVGAAVQSLEQRIIWLFTPFQNNAKRKTGDEPKREKTVQIYQHLRVGSMPDTTEMIVV
jgi:hypothetical protein